MSNKFDPTPYIISVNRKDYLPVAARLIWFRAERPNWSIQTTPVEINLEKQYAIFKATILDQDGRIIATAHKIEDARGFPDFAEKAETSSVGRALAMCGYGTQFCGVDLDELQNAEAPRLADAPVIRPGQPTQTRTVQPAQPQQPVRQQAPPQPRQSGQPEEPNPLALARLAYATAARELGHPVNNGDKFIIPKVYELFRQQTNQDPLKATIEDWHRAAHLLNSWRPPQAAPAPSRPAPPAALANRPPAPPSHHEDEMPFDDPFAE